MWKALCIDEHVGSDIAPSSDRIHDEADYFTQSFSLVALLLPSLLCAISPESETAADESESE